MCALSSLCALSHCAHALCMCSLALCSRIVCSRTVLSRAVRSYSFVVRTREQLIAAADCRGPGAWPDEAWNHLHPWYNRAWHYGDGSRVEGSALQQQEWKQIADRCSTLSSQSNSSSMPLSVVFKSRSASAFVFSLSALWDLCVTAAPQRAH